MTDGRHISRGLQTGLNVVISFLGNWIVGAVVAPFQFYVADGRLLSASAARAFHLAIASYALLVRMMARQFVWTGNALPHLQQPADAPAGKP